MQEYKGKLNSLSGEYRVHLIGALQRNKAKAAVELFDVIETIDGREIADAVDGAAAKRGKVQEVFLQINVSQDAAKHGCADSEAAALADHIRGRCPNLSLRGLMAITRFYEEPQGARGDYARLRGLAETLRVSEPLELSMGMSLDFEIAVEEGATLVRIGSALFGKRCR